MLLPGDPAPDFTAASNVNPQYHFDTVAGRYVVLCFFGSGRHPFAQKLLEEIQQKRAGRFDITNAVFFGVSADRDDAQRLSSNLPGIKFIWDFDLAVAKKYDAIGEVRVEAPPAGEAPADPAAPPKTATAYRPRTVLLDQALRVVAILPFGGDPAAYIETLFQLLDHQPKLAELSVPAPVLVVPNVFEREVCKVLVDYYNQHGGEDSGFMRDIGGKTVGVTDYAHKRRADCEIKDENLIKVTQERIARRIVPAIAQAFQFHANRIERHIVACYDASDGGHFRAHRDNTTLGTAHRRFAVTMNLNAEDYEGGELWFPEFSPRRYRAATGGAVVFSCSLMHEATQVTKGQRFAFLPFLYDDAAARVREQNRQFLAGGPKLQGNPIAPTPAT